MSIDRRRLFAGLAGAGAVAAAAEAQSMPAREAVPKADIDAALLGVRPNAADDQSQALQRAIEHAAAARAVLRLPPGFYRAGGLQVPAYAAISGVAGATRLVMSTGPSLLSATGSDHLSISGLVLDGAGIPLPERRGLLHVAQSRAVQISNCEVINSGRNGIALEAVEDDITANAISGGDAAIFSIDARGLRIAGNTVRGTANGGILVWRSSAGDDGTQSHRRRHEQSRRFRTMGQRHQCLSRRQCHRPRQPHSQRRLLRGARQCRVQPANRRQYL